MMLKVLCFCFGISFYVVQADYDYRWENYNGTVPEDAISVDSNGEKIYIGQSYTLYGGCAGVLKPNVVELELNCEGYRIRDNESDLRESIRILCADHKEKYFWKPTDKETFPKILDYDRFVFIGQRNRFYSTENQHSNLWVGRYVRPDAEPPIVFGSIEEGDGSLYYAANGQAYNVSGSYEALVYEPEGEKTQEKAEDKATNTDEKTEECAKPPDQAEAEIKTPTIKSEPPEEEPSNQKPHCPDIIKEGVNAANSAVNKAQIDVANCLDVKVSTPSEIDPQHPKVEIDQTNVELPTQTKVSPTGKFTVG